MEAEARFSFLLSSEEAVAAEEVGAEAASEEDLVAVSAEAVEEALAAEVRAEAGKRISGYALQTLGYNIY